MAAPPPLTSAGFAASTGVSRETLARLDAYIALLCRWQTAMNLVGGETIQDVWRRHVLDSAQLLPLLPPGARTITDIGSGAGFPGLVLAIMGAAPVHLIESSAKKVAFLREAARIAAAGATVHHGRIEDMVPWPSDVVTARALAPLHRLLDYAAPYLSGPDAACLFLKGAHAEGELTEARKSWTMTAERFDSATDPAGVIFRIRGLARERSAPEQR